MSITHPPAHPPLTHADEIAALCRQGVLLLSAAGTITNPRTGHVYGANRALKEQYFVVGATCPHRKRRFTAYLHRILWTYFHGPIPEGMQVNHKDGDTKNNALTNLELITPSENTRHAVRTGAMQQKLGPAAADAMRRQFVEREDITKSELASAFQVHIAMVTRVLRNESYHSDEPLALQAAALHGQRFPGKPKAVREGDSEARKNLQRVLDLIQAGAIAVDPVAPSITGVHVWCRTYLPRKTVKYAAVSVQLEAGKPATFIPAHRIMWAAFHGLPAEGRVVHHRNADKADFRLSNLELTSTRKNAQYAAAEASHEHAKVDERLASRVRSSFLERPRAAREIGREFELSQRTVRTMLLDETHQYGCFETRARARAAYARRTARWTKPGTKRGGTCRPAQSCQAQS